MDAASDCVGESKPVCHCAPKSVAHRWLPGFYIALCVLMSLSSVTVCVVMSFRTLQLENRMQMEMDKASIFQPQHAAFLNEDGTLIPELSTPIEWLVEEKIRVMTPKSRTARDVGQDCSCPPGMWSFSLSHSAPISVSITVHHIHNFPITASVHLTHMLNRCTQHWRMNDLHVLGQHWYRLGHIAAVHILYAH